MAVLALAPALVLAGAMPANAAAGSGLMSTTIFAYAQSDEFLGLAFSNSDAITVTDPEGTVVETCTGACSWSGSAPVDGVWSIQYEESGDNLTAWDVYVEDGLGAQIPGRVWSERWMIGATSFATIRDIDAYYLSEFGVQYRASFTGHRGWAFSLAASNRGVMHADGSCLSAYRSVPPPGTVEPASGPLPAMSGDDYTLDGGCAASGLVNYRVFLGEPIAADLPASTANWADGRTSDRWVLPAYVSPSVVDLAYERSGASSAGELSGSLTGQSGTLRIRIDTDGDGDDAGPADVVIDTAFPVGAFTIPWDGIDGLGQPVPAERALAITVELTAESEIHFVDTDVEGRTGGIEVTRLNGPAAPDTRLSWDDSRLPGGRITETAELVGDLVDSTGGVHSWGFDGNGWGNGRVIEDWMFIYPSASAELTVPGLDPTAVEDDEEERLPDTGLEIDAQGVLLAFGLLAAGAVIAFARGRRRAAAD